MDERCREGFCFNQMEYGCALPAGHAGPHRHQVPVGWIHAPKPEPPKPVIPVSEEATRAYFDAQGECKVDSVSPIGLRAAFKVILRDALKNLPWHGDVREPLLWRRSFYRDITGEEW